MAAPSVSTKLPNVAPVEEVVAVVMVAVAGVVDTRLPVVEGMVAAAVDMVRVPWVLICFHMTDLFRWRWLRSRSLRWWR